MSGVPPLDPAVEGQVPRPPAFGPASHVHAGPAWSAPVLGLFKDGLHDGMGLRRLESVAEAVRAYAYQSEVGGFGGGTS